MQTSLFFPWQADETCTRVVVSVVAVDLKHPWPVYGNYAYLRRVHPKLSRIERHYWGLKKPRETIFIAPRVVHLVNVTDCIPVSPSGKELRSFHQIQTIEHCDHTTYWCGPNCEPFILTEPYYPHRAELQDEIDRRGLTAIILPNPGLYAGGGEKTCSVLMGLPEHRAILHKILATITTTDWPPMPVVRQLTWAEAQQLSLDQAREVCDV